MDLGLTDKVVLITGGSEGIGRATAEEFAREGARVAICARRADVLQQAAGAIEAATGAPVLAVPTDVSRAGDLATCVTTVTARLGPITVLVNNAGTSAAAAFETVADEGWYADLDLKLLAAVRAVRLVLPGMRAAGGGRIVNLTNIGAKAPGARSVPTSVSRAAGIALTKALSRELAPDNILVNTVCIGLIKSAQIGRAAQRVGGEAGVEDGYARLGANVPLGRVGEAHEVAGLIAFLCSVRGSYITGVAINVDGGTSPVV